MKNKSKLSKVVFDRIAVQEFNSTPGSGYSLGPVET